MEKQKRGFTHQTLHSLMAEMVLDKVIRNYHIQKLYRDIDNALSTGDRQTFYRLTEELNELLSLAKVN
jgi:uncharacterized protein YpiB (UPF0302 family)